MSFSNFRQKVHEAAAPVEDPTKCQANGCPNRGTVSIGSTGKYACTAHAFSEGRQWPAITEKANDLKWFADFIAEVQALVNAPPMVPGTNPPKFDNRAWLTLTERFWDGQDDHMQPSEFERKSPSAYLLRCLGEFQYRLGARQERPEKWTEPSYTKGGSRFAHLLSKEVA